MPNALPHCQVGLILFCFTGYANEYQKCFYRDSKLVRRGAGSAGGCGLEGFPGTEPALHLFGVS